MRKIIQYITFFCLVGFTVTSDSNAIAGGCSNHINQKAEIKCAEGDNECQSKKNEKIELSTTVSS
tara:strand:- start:369 stop:563 length:195 start_codon:yes stop_codon:yes gene_type:complete